MLQIKPLAESRTHVVLALSGQLTGTWVDALQRTCERELDEGRSVTLNLEQLVYVDTSGVRMMRALYARGIRMERARKIIAELLDESDNS